MEDSWVEEAYKMADDWEKAGTDRCFEWDHLRYAASADLPYYYAEQVWNVIELDLQPALTPILH